MKRKFTVELPDDVWEDMQKHVPWGLRGAVAIALLRLAIIAAKNDGYIALGAIIEGKYKIVSEGWDAKA